MIDVTQQINSVRRQVGTRLVEAGEARTMIISQTYAAGVEDVWDACTNPERISRWFLPVSGDLRLHGRYQLQGNASGTIERCEPPNSFAASWEFGGEVSWIEVQLSPAADGGTRFELQHTAGVEDTRWAEFGPGAVGVGWELGLTGLSRHLSTGAAVDPVEGMAWMATDEGKHFISLSSQYWCDANVAAGADPADARAAADRTTVAYTPPPVSGEP